MMALDLSCLEDRWSAAPLKDDVQQQVADMKLASFPLPQVQDVRVLVSAVFKSVQREGH